MGVAYDIGEADVTLCELRDMGLVEPEMTVTAEGAGLRFGVSDSGNDEPGQASIRLDADGVREMMKHAGAWLARRDRGDR